MRPLALLVVSILALAGCTGGPRSGDPSPTPAADGTFPVTCEVLGIDGKPLAGAFCSFDFGGRFVRKSVDAEGVATESVKMGLSGRVRGTAEGHGSKSAAFVVDAPKHVQMVLEPLPPGAPEQEDPGPTSLPPGNSTDPPLPGTRAWGEVLTVSSDGNNEPHLAIDSQGVIYYAPTSDLYRSKNGGESFTELIIQGALPTLGSDTAVHVAPDDSVWFSRYWGYADSTLGCASKDKGESWTCDNNAIPGATDRMWIAGVDKTQGFVQANEGLYHNVWARSTDGSTKYVPYGTTTTLIAIRNGNMVFDDKRDAVWQIQSIGSTQHLYRVDNGGGLITGADTGIPETYAIPWISVHDGVLWTTGETGGKVLAARSTDGGKTWKRFTVSSEPKSATFSYAAAGPGGRAAVVYYGSDKSGASTSNGGVWSLYVAETDNALDAFPTWVETRLVDKIHVGNVCIGLSCEQNGNDPYARFSGDLIGIAIDPEGYVHVAFNEDDNTAHTVHNQYVRQVPPTGKP